MKHLLPFYWQCLFALGLRHKSLGARLENDSLLHSEPHFYFVTKGLFVDHIVNSSCVTNHPRTRKSVEWLEFSWTRLGLAGETWLGQLCSPSQPFLEPGACFTYGAGRDLSG